MMYTTVKYIHALHGKVFGEIVRKIFLNSVESVGQIDIMFETCEDAQHFLKIIAVENAISAQHSKTHGLNEYTITRTTASNSTCEIVIRIHSYFAGLTRNQRFPKNTPQPSIDIDYVVWDSQGIREQLPKQCKVDDTGVSPPSTISYLMDRVMMKRFAMVNPTMLRNTTACLLVLEKCHSLIADHGFTQDTVYKTPFRPILLKKIHDCDSGTYCTIGQDLIPIGHVVITLPCLHNFGFENMYQWIKTQGATDTDVKCPNCQDIFISPHALVD